MRIQIQNHGQDEWPDKLVQHPEVKFWEFGAKRSEVEASGWTYGNGHEV